MVRGKPAKVRREWLGAALVVIAASVVSQRGLAAVKSHVICTEREPADAPVHFRFENGETQPEIILDLDYSTPEETAAPWVVGRTYTVMIDDDFESAVAVGAALHTARAECTAEGRDKFRLRSSQTLPSTSASLNWAQDPIPAVKPWTRARSYTVRILESPRKIDPVPSSPPTRTPEKP